MSPLLLLSLAFLLAATPCLGRLVIDINSSTPLRFSSLAWDPSALHFVAGSATGPTVYGISDSGRVKCLLSEPSSNSSGVFSVNALAVDNVRRRLIVSFSNPSSIAAYDLKLYRKIYAVPLPELDGDPGGVAVDSESGEVAVSSGRRGVVLKVGPEGKTKNVISGFKISEGLGGILYLSHGCILTVEPATGKFFKVDFVNDHVEEVLVTGNSSNSSALAQSSLAIALQTERVVAVATNHSIVTLESDDTWARVAAFVLTVKLRAGDTVVAVAMQEGHRGDVVGSNSTLYVLVKSKTGYRIEEAAWKEHLKAYLIASFFFLGLLPWLYFCFLLSGMPDELKKTVHSPYGHCEPVNWREICCCFREKMIVDQLNYVSKAEMHI